MTEDEKQKLIELVLEHQHDFAKENCTIEVKHTDIFEMLMDVKNYVKERNITALWEDNPVRLAFGIRCSDGRYYLIEIRDVRISNRDNA